jgi:hypothetical protein
MADPAITACPAGQWTKVATNVTTGQIHKRITIPMYLSTYRDSGGGAPTLQTEGVPITTNSADISFSAGADVYIWCIGSDGSVRVDL